MGLNTSHKVKCDAVGCKKEAKTPYEDDLPRGWGTITLGKDLICAAYHEHTPVKCFPRYCCPTHFAQIIKRFDLSSVIVWHEKDV